MFEQLLSNPEAITFPVLFVGLLIYVMKTNNDREQQYRETINRLSNHLEVVEDIKEDVDNIHNHFINATKKENKS